MSLITITDVTSVKLLPEFILAGIGSHVHVFDRVTGKLTQRLHVLKAQKIYGFVPNEGQKKILVHGGKQFTVLAVGSEGLVETFAAVACNDWLMAAMWMNESVVALLTAHNVVQKWDTSTQQQTSTHKSSNVSLLYSGLLHHLQDGILVFAGTVFSEVLIECCVSNETRTQEMHSLKGHNGVIFSICYNEAKNLIVSTSDDRSVRIWGPQPTKDKPTNTIAYWKKVVIDCKHEVYGHTSRVMRSFITENHIVSFGEDSGICFWDLNGKLSRKISAHQSGCIWSVDSDKEYLITGGRDAGIMLHPLSVATDYAEHGVLNISVGSLKKIAYTARNNIVILTEKSDLIYYDVKLKQASSQLKLEHESTYIMLAMSSCKQIIAVIDMAGNLDVFTENCKGEPGLKNVIHTKLEIGKVLSMQWTGNRHLVLCGAAGELTVLASKGNSTELYAKFVLPHCKERWLTAAAMDNDTFVLGDRCGNMHIHCKDQTDPIKSLPKVHGRYGPSTICLRNGKITTTGRDGTIKYFLLDKELKSVASKELNFEWVSKFLDIDQNIVCGFQERDFVVYHVKNNVKILQIPCGGGHRSWDAHRYIEKVNDKYEEFIKLLYVKNSSLNEVKFQMSKIVSKHIISGTHVKEINCLTCLKPELDIAEKMFISGGEDTTVRFTKINTTTGELTDEIVYRHLSNVRALKTYKIGPNKWLLVTAGGRAQICVKVIEISTVDEKVDLKTESLVDYMIKGTDKQRKGGKSWKEHKVDFNPETRIMDVEITKNNDDNFVIYAGCSDAYLRIYEFNIKTGIFKQLQEIKYHSTCILKTKIFEINQKIILTTCTTKGEATFWDVTDLTKDVKQIFETATNKAGINSIDIKVNSDKEFILATGGDDNALALNKIDISNGFKVIETIVKDTYHSSQITGVIFLDDITIATSIDQRVTKLVVGGGALKCEFVMQCCVDVADVQGMDIVEVCSDSTTVCVFGKGLELVQLPKH